MAALMCIACLCLAGGSLTPAQAESALDRPAVGPDPLISASPALSGIHEARVLVVTVGASYAASYENLVKQAIAELEREGIRHAERDDASIPRFVIRIESTLVPDCQKHVYRVQGGLCRLMMLPNDSPVSVQAEVWQLLPVVGVASRSAVAGAVESAVTAQVDAFAAAVRAVRQRSTAEADTQQDASGVRSPADGLGLTAASKPLFVASKSGSVFHRPDCRWAQNISADNLIGYKTREEAVQSGKRPCKSCKP